MNNFHNKIFTFNYLTTHVIICPFSPCKAREKFEKKMKDNMNSQRFCTSFDFQSDGAKLIIN